MIITCLFCWNTPSYFDVADTIVIDVFSLLVLPQMWKPEMLVFPSNCGEDTGVLLSLLCENGFVFFVGHLNCLH